MSKDFLVEGIATKDVVQLRYLCNYIRSGHDGLGWGDNAHRRRVSNLFLDIHLLNLRTWD